MLGFGASYTRGLTVLSLLCVCFRNVRRCARHFCLSCQNRLCQTLHIWDEEYMGLGKCAGWPFHDLDPRSRLWHWLTLISLSALIQSLQIFAPFPSSKLSTSQSGSSLEKFSESNTAPARAIVRATWLELFILIPGLSAIICCHTFHYKVIWEDGSYTCMAVEELWIIWKQQVQHVSSSMCRLCDQLEQEKLLGKVHKVTYLQCCT